MAENASPPSYKADDTYYWDFATFLVEDTLFRIPRHNLVKESGSFAQQYGIGGGPSKFEPVSVTDYAPANLVKLDVSVHDFRAFLKVLYPMMSLPKYEIDPKRSKPTPFQVEPTLTENEWRAVLKLSSRWHFNNIRAMAIAALTASEMDPVTKANLAKEYHVKQWLLSAYGALVQRALPISVDEAEKLQWKNAIVLFQLRETHRDNPKQGAAALKQKIRGTFVEEFTRIRAVQREYSVVKTNVSAGAIAGRAHVNGAEDLTDTDEEAAATKSTVKAGDQITTTQITAANAPQSYGFAFGAPRQVVSETKPASCFGSSSNGAFATAVFAPPSFAASSAPKFSFSGK